MGRAANFRRSSGNGGAAVVAACTILLVTAAAWYSGRGASVKGGPRAHGLQLESVTGSDAETIAYLRAKLTQVTAEKRSIRRALGALSCETKGIGPTGGFCLNPQQDSVGGNDFLSVGLADELYQLFSGRTVFDLGAGLGHYELYWREKQGQAGAAPGGGPASVVAFDGAENIENVTGGRVLWADLTEPLDLADEHGVADWVMSLEVAEHISAAKEDVFLDNLHRHNRRGIVMSWAVPGQGGHHHINLRGQDYVVQRMRRLGYRFDAEFTAKVRRVAPGETCGPLRVSGRDFNVCTPWFRDTVYVFTR